MPDTTINNVLNDFEKLDDNDKEFFLELATKQLTELKRKKLVDSVREAEQNYKAGNIKSGSVDDLLKDLDND
jgi:hypothetical protein